MGLWVLFKLILNHLNILKNLERFFYAPLKLPTNQLIVQPTGVPRDPDKLTEIIYIYSTIFHQFMEQFETKKAILEILLSFIEKWKQ